MARFHGAVGFNIVSDTDDQDTGIARNTVVEKTFYGRVIEHVRRWQGSDTNTEDLTLGNQIAITANDYAFQHATGIVYVYYMGGRWKVTSMRRKHPEIILTLGGVYNGPIPSGVSGEAEDAGSESVVHPSDG